MRRPPLSQPGSQGLENHLNMASTIVGRPLCLLSPGTEADGGGGREEAALESPILIYHTPGSRRYAHPPAGTLPLETCLPHDG